MPTEQRLIRSAIVPQNMISTAIGRDNQMAMQSNDKMSVAQRWDNYRPTKSLLVWAAAGAAVATLVVGFTWGGWVTGGTSQKLVATAQGVARSELVADICVDRFNAAPDTSLRLTELKALTSASAKRQFVEAGGWATMPGQTSADKGGTDACIAALTA